MKFDRAAFAAQLRPVWLWHVPVLLVLFVLDQDLTEVATGLAHGWPLYFASEVITPLGKGYNQLPLLISSAVLLAALRRSRPARVSQQALGAFVISAVAANLLKFTIQRPRPLCPAGLAPGWLEALGDPDWLSYPSADAATTFAIAWVLGSGLPRGRLLLWAIALLVGLARVFRQCHYSSDVYVGALVGVLSGQLALCVSWRSRPAPGKGHARPRAKSRASPE